MQGRDIAISIQNHPEFRYISPLQKILYCGTYIYAPTQETDVTGKLEELINSDPGLFLERYGEMLSNTELSYFSNNSSYEVKHYLTTCQDKKAIETLKRNRRFTKLHQLIEEGDYFSEEAVKSRAPELYHEYVGKYRRTDDEAWQGLSLSQALMKLQQRAEEREKFGEKLEDISPEELEDSEDLLIRIMHERFLEGTDRIEGVSDDETLDDIKQITQDAEDKYFDMY